jgi:hypothetical protein
MLSIERCDEILKSNGTKLNNEEIKNLREYLYFLANLQVEDENNKSITDDEHERDIVL